MHTPSPPVIQPRATLISPVSRPSPKPQAVQLEAVKERERETLKKRKGFMSTILTRGGLGQAQTQKAKALGE